jgi:hypothetical protein
MRQAMNESKGVKHILTVETHNLGILIALITLLRNNPEFNLKRTAETPKEEPKILPLKILPFRKKEG